LIEQGVEGLFAKGASNAELYEKLPLILRGGRYVSPTCLALIGDGTELPQLTPRERQTLNMVLKGRTTKEIADAQGVSPRTAEKHRASMMSKLGVRSIAALMAKALEFGLIDG
jgi:DNA-binding NarL/FixJ family response regulator